jgi:subtilase family serine protease
MPITRLTPMKKSLLLLVAAGFVILIAAGAGSAAVRDGQPQRDHDHGHWFERACTLPIPWLAGCGAQVVSDASGTPLAGTTPPAGAYGPAQFHAGYSLPTNASTSQTIAIVDAYDDPNIASDLAVYSTYYGLPSCTTTNGCFRKVNQSGGTSYPSANSGWALEISLDVEVAHAICQNCKIVLVEASSNSFANLGAAENEAAALGANVISNSWGGGEFSSETSYDTAYFNHPGVMITASAGDSGYGVEYPAASRYVTAVGGTTLNLNADQSYQSESVWNGTGSGCSLYEPKPSWQHDSGCSRRTVADVSADADPNTGAAVYDTVPYSGQSGWFQVGGTSLAAPLIGSVYALTGSASGNNYGSAPYAQANQLHDVTTGSNGSCSVFYLCNAQAGYDGPTGLGTPFGIAAFSSGPVTPDFSIASSPVSRTVVQGSGTSYSITMTPSGGFAHTVNLSDSGISSPPAGSFSPAAVSNGTPTAIFSVTTASNTAPGTYTLTLYGTDAANPSLVHSIPVTLVVQAAPVSDFSLSISPPNQRLRTPGSTAFTVTVNPVNGFAGSVSLSVSGLPSGFGSSFSPNPTGSSSTLTITAPRSSRRTLTFTVTGTSGSLVHSTSATLTLR